jgi:ArsR family transcriptional regulator
MFLLSQKELCVCEICEILGLTQPKVSRHLAKLRDLGFVRDERQGQWIFYYPDLKDNLLRDIIEKITEYADHCPLLKNDLSRLKEKEKIGDLCKRTKPSDAPLADE